MTETTKSEFALNAQSIKMSYSKKEVLKNINIQIPHGQAIALLGPNGAGKSTFLKIITGLLRPDAGSVEIMGLNPFESNEQLFRNIGFVTEKRGLWPWMTVKETINYAKGLSFTWDIDEEKRLLRDFNLSDDTKVGNLSKGEQGKLNLLLTLSCKPDLLIMDEPTTGLDPVVRRSILEEVINIMLEQGKTVIYSTHEMHEAERLAEKVFMINHGEIILAEMINDLKQTHRLVTAVNSDSKNIFDNSEHDDLISFSSSGNRFRFAFKNWNQAESEKLSKSGFKDINVQPVTLEDIFCYYCQREVK